MSPEVVPPLRIFPVHHTSAAGWTSHPSAVWGTTSAGLPGERGPSCTCPRPCPSLFPQLRSPQAPTPFPPSLSRCCALHSLINLGPLGITSLHFQPSALQRSLSTLVPIPTSFLPSEKRAWPSCSRRIILPEFCTCLSGDSLRMFSHLLH